MVRDGSDLSWTPGSLNIGEQSLQSIQDIVNAAGHWTEDGDGTIIARFLHPCRNWRERKNFARRDGS